MSAVAKTPSIPGGASQDAIEAHYDTGNEFFGLWLDESMTYSCALWDNVEDLDSAQKAKLRYHVKEAGIKRGDRVLDIGCGWGGLLSYLQDIGAGSTVGLTLSQAQAEFVNKKELPNTDVRLKGWEDFESDEKFDGIISIGAFEHFATRHLAREERVAIYRRFFVKCHTLLEESGRLSLQTIACGNMKRDDFSRFFETEIFPESDLPSLGEIADACQCLFETVRLRNDRLDYARTMRAWHRRLWESRDAAEKVAGSKVLRRYLKYFKLAILAFEAQASMDLFRITLRRIDRPRV